MIYRFGDFELDERVFELRRAGHPVDIEPKVFDVLGYLLRHRDRVVPKDELFAQLWPGEFVSDSALTSCIKAVRRAVHDDGASQKVIRTFYGRGYRFIASVSVLADQAKDTGAPPRIPSPSAEPRARASTETRPGSGLRTSSTFVGREPELAQLQRMLDDAFSGHGGLALLLGEPGIGKTRLADELAEAARQQRARVLIARSYEGDGAPAFWLWVQVMRAYGRDQSPPLLRRIMGDGAVDIARGVPEVRELLPDLPASPALEPGQARFRLFDSFTTFLKTAAHQQPLVVILDDLHWADHPSLLLLQFVARELHEARVLIVGTYRDLGFERHHPLAQTLGELARVPYCRRIALRGLSIDDVARFIAATTGMAAAPSFVATVHRDTEGNPFFVTEIVRVLTMEQLGSRGEGPASVKPAIPQTLREAIGRHLDQLSQACSSMLGIASVIGREFDLSILQRTLRGHGVPPGALLKALDEGSAARIIEESPHVVGRYRFSHALVRDALYETLPRSERVQWHHRVAGTLEGLHAANLEPHFALLAHHFYQASAGEDVAKAVEYAVRAGEQATRLLAYEAAVGHYQNAIQLIDASDAPRRCALLVALGDNQWKTGDTARARQTFHEAAALARRLGSAELFARAALGFGDALRGFEVGIVQPEMIDLLEQALHMLGATDDALQVQVMARLAVALYHVPDSLERRASLSRRAVDIAARLSDPVAHLAALYGRHWAIWSPDSLDDRLSTATEMVRLADPLRDKEMSFHAHRFRLMDLLESGARQGVDAELAICTGLAEDLRQHYYSWYIATFRAMRAFLDGRFDDSERLAQEALTIGQRAQNQNVAQVFGMQLFAVRKEQGRLAELEAPTRAFISLYPALPAWRAALAVICSESGDDAGARATFEELAADDFEAIPRDTFWLAAVAGLADVCAFLGDGRRAAILLELLEPYAERNVVMTPGTACSGAAARPLGRLAALLGRWTQAGQHFERALSIDERVGAPHFIAHTQRDYAEMLLAHDEPGDRRKAAALLSQARLTYERLGMTSCCRKAAALTCRIGDPVDSAGEAETSRPRSRVTVLRPRSR